MRITAFIGAALIALCSLAMAPVAMADPAPDICVLDLAPPVDHVYDAAPAGAVCSSPFIAVKPLASIMPGGDDDEAAGPAAVLMLIALDFANHRLHGDPGRALI